MKEFPKKFLSLRDKNGSKGRPKATPPAPPNNNKPRPLSAQTFMSMFKADHSRQNSKDSADKEKDNARIEEIIQRLDELNITNVAVEHIKDILATDYANGNAEKAVQFIDLEQKAASGVIMPYDRSIHMVGAENRGNVTCYLDALLFAMFSKLDAFDCMLKNDFPEEDNRSKLVNLLRMWVNMLRTGKLIHTDMTKLIQDSLADCGWSDARMLEQQDTSEAFAFITETLQLPLLSLQVDLFHQGKGDKDDHKVVYERLLNLAVPPDPEDKGIKLEDCLEEYFNAQVDVKRDSDEGKKSALLDTPSEMPKLFHRDTIRLVTEETGESSSTITASPIAISPLSQLQGFNEDAKQSPTDLNQDTKENSQEGENKVATDGLDAAARPAPRHRSTSVIQRVVLDEQGRPSSTDNVTMLQKAVKRGSTVVKAVTIPAWQFFRLIPWHAVHSNEPRNDVEVAMNFDQRPVVGICLKRYAMTESGHPKRHNTFIDIPDSLRLPHFMIADDAKAEEDPNVLNTEYKLVLQSVICHRGDSLQSGHYISFARVAPKLLTDNRRHDFDPPPDYEEAQWVKFDDLEVENRVTYIDDIKQSMKEEMPYLLFYQVVPMMEMSCPSVDGTETEPPSYNDSKISIDMPPTPIIGSSSRDEGYFDSTPTAESSYLQHSKPPSIRFSSESERPSRMSMESSERDPFSGSILGDSRRPSVNWSESKSVTPAVTPNSHSPAVTPSEETTASRLSRAASRFTKATRSRPTSQSGEGRTSFSMTRLSGLMRASKEPLAEPNGSSIASSKSTGQLATDSTKGAMDSSMELDAQHLQPQRQSFDDSRHHQKHGHKRIRSKEKVPKDKGGKAKSSSQPERECTVM